MGGNLAKYSLNCEEKMFPILSNQHTSTGHGNPHGLPMLTRGLEIVVAEILRLSYTPELPGELVKSPIFGPHSQISDSVG